jgi:glycosyltransferase involved in cell wall biosynthesis
MKKVLIITYYWPPSGGAGVQRWLKFVKYIRDYGWEPIIYTPENPESPANDDSLEKDIPIGTTILRSPIWEPYTAYKKFVGRKKDDKIKAGFLTEKKTPSLTENISVWIRGNFFIPDARKFWIKPSIKHLSKYLKENPVDVIVSTGPPHSMHLIALGIKKKFNIPWLADFRDPWTHIDFYDKLKLQGFADKKHKKLEQEVLKNADQLVTVSWNWAEDFKKLGAKKIDVITNGYDEDDFTIEGSASNTERFDIIHIGSMNADRNPKVFWKVLADLCKEKSDFKDQLKIHLIGQTDYTVLQSINHNNLGDKLIREEYMSHQDVLNYAGKADILLLPLNNTPNVNGIIPGKLFEYLGLHKPIFGIGLENGDSDKILKETHAGKMHGFEDYEGMKKTLEWHGKNFMTGNSDQAFDAPEIKKYTRKNLTSTMCKLLNDMLN